MIAAICDDQPVFIETLAGLLEKNDKIDVIFRYSDLEKFEMDLMNQKRFDLVFMDIDWGQHRQNGISFASEVNRRNSLIQIIYVTAYSDRFSQSIFLEPANLCGFLSKPVREEILSKLIDKAYKKLIQSEQDKLVLTQKGHVISIPHQHITYIESMGHRVVIHTDYEDYNLYMKLNEVAEKLGWGFVQCHKSYLVNMHSIRRIDINTVLLKNGTTIPISRAKAAVMRETYFHYMGRQL